MNLRQKTILIILGTLAMLMLSFYLITRFVLLDNYETLERQIAQEETASAARILTWYQGRMLQTLADWADWDDTYAFVESRDPAFVASNLVPETFSANHLDLIAIHDIHGQPLYAQAFDREAGEPRPLSAAEQEVFERLFALRGGAPFPPGIFVHRFENALYLLAMHPIRQSDTTGQPRGTLFMARRFNETLTAEFTRMLGKTVRVRNILDHPDCFAVARQMAARGEAWRLDMPGPETLRGRILLQNRDGFATGLLDVHLDRPVARHAERTAAILIALFLLAALCFGLGVLWLIQTQILARLRRMMHQTRHIADSTDTSIRLHPGGDDELAALADSINRMLDALVRVDAQRLESERQLRTITDNMTVGTTLLDSTLRVLAVNPCMRRWFPEAFPTPETEPTGMEGLLDDAAVCRRVLQTGIAETVDFSIPGTSGTRRFIATYCPIPGTDGRMHQLLRLLEDVTERRRMEERLEQTRRLQAVGTLAAGIAHEINNPLNSLQLRMGMLEMQLEDGAPPPRDLLLQRVRDLTRDIERIRDIVRHMRALVRARANQDAAVGAVDLAPVVEAGLDILRAQLQEHHVDVTCTLTPDLPPVKAEARPLELVLVNLVVNAVHALRDAHTPDPRIRIQAYPRGGSVFLDVEDNGPGLGGNPDKIFDPFFTTKAESESMGIGLSLVLGMIAGWDAGIEAGASPLGGALFRLELQTAGDDA